MNKKQAATLAGKQGALAQSRLKAKLPEIKAREVKPSVLAFVRDMRGSMTAQVGARTYRRLLKAVDGLFQSGAVAPGDLGMKSKEELVAKIVDMMRRLEAEKALLRLNAQKLTAKEIVAKAKGLRATFSGELFELLVHNHISFNKKLREEALLELRDLLRAGLSNEASLNGLVVNALGKRTGAKPLLKKMQAAGVLADIEKKGVTSPYLKRVTNIWTDDGEGKKKFTDFAYVIHFQDGTDDHILYLVGVEVKMPRAARSFPEQIGGMSGRFRRAGEVLMTIDGEERVVDPTNILFVRSVGSLVYGVRPTSNPLGGSYFSPARGPDAQLSKRTQTVFNFYSLPMDVAGIRGIVTVPFTLGP